MQDETEVRIAVIDESGDTGLTKKSSKNFINTAVIINNIYSLERIAKTVYRKKILNKHKRDQLHANKDNQKVHEAILKELSLVEYKVVYVNNKDYFKNLDLLFVKLAKLNVKTVYIAIRDSRRKTLERIVILGSKFNISIVFSTPINNKALQIADFVSWVIFRKLECGDEKYFKQLKLDQK